MEVRVVTSALTGAGAQLTGLAGQLRAVEGTVTNACGEAGSAAGFPEPTGALEDVSSRWAPALAQTSEAIDGTATALQAAAGIYAITDMTAMP